MIKRTNGLKIFIFAIDGAIPEFVRKFADEGKLPNIGPLIDNGTFGDLATTLPGVSPTAWTSFATGQEPTKHGIVDFVCKKAKSYDLELQIHRSRVNEKGMRIYEKNRITKAFWEIADENGLKCIIIHLPATFPPDRMQKGMMISGMGIQDLRDTFGVTSLYTTEPVRLTGVEIKILAKESDGWFVSDVEGPLGVKIPLYFKRERDRLLITKEKDRSPILQLKVKQWSPWVSFSFPVAGGEAVEGVTQFKLLDLDGDRVQVIRVPVQPSPYHQLNPYTYPPELAREIAENIGHYKILDRTEDGMDNETFLEDVWDRIEKKTEITKYLMRSRDWDIFLSYVHTIDNVQHVMWCYIDPTNPKYDPEEAKLWGDSIEKAYQKVDWFVGEIMDLIDERNTIVLMVSDHGGCSIHKWIHLNTWLHDQGYLVTHEGGESTRAKWMSYRVTSNPHSRPVDWKATKAYVVGAGGIYVNLKGREPMGFVQRGREYVALRNEIAKKLLEVVDPESGRRIFKKVLFREQVWRGPKAEIMPDIVPIFEKGYTMAMEDIFGEVLVGVPFYERAIGRWSGTHGGPFDPWENAGIFLAYGPKVKKGHQLEGAEIIDVAPTILHLLGIEIPEDMDGKVLETIFE